MTVTPATLALGRILRLASRPAQPGDVADYERCRVILLDTLESAAPDYSPNYARDSRKGARGDA